MLPIALSLRGRLRLDHAAAHRGPVHRARAVHQQRAGALALRLQHRPVAAGDHRRRRVLDHALGPGRAAARDAADRLPGRARPARAAAAVLRGAARRPAGAGAGGEVLPAPARGRPARGRGAGRGPARGAVRCRRCWTSMVLPALLFAEQDRQRGVLEPRRARELAAACHDDRGRSRRAAGHARVPAPSEAASTPSAGCCAWVHGTGWIRLPPACWRSCCGRDGSDRSRPWTPAALLHGGRRPEPFDAVCLSFLDAVRPGRRAACCCGSGPSWARTPACVCLWGCSAETSATAALTNTGRGRCRQPRRAVTKTAVDAVAQSAAAARRTQPGRARGQPSLVLVRVVVRDRV